MAVPLEQFVKQLEDSGILAGDTLQDFIPQKASPKGGQELLRELVRQRKLTKYQAEQVWQGKGKSLVLGNYLLLEKIGQGGMGAVYKAEHRRMKRIVAVKMLSATMLNNPAAAARFQREVEAAAKLEHPNIVAAFDADQGTRVTDAGVRQLADALPQCKIEWDGGIIEPTRAADSERNDRERRAGPTLSQEQANASRHPGLTTCGNSWGGTGRVADLWVSAASARRRWLR